MFCHFGRRLNEPRVVVSIIAMGCMGLACFLLRAVYEKWLWEKKRSIKSRTFQRNLKIDRAMVAVIAFSLIVERPLNFFAGLNTKTCPSEEFLVARKFVGTVTLQALPWLTWIKTITTYVALKRCERQKEEWTKWLNESLGQDDGVWYERSHNRCGSPMWWAGMAIGTITVLSVVASALPSRHAWSAVNLIGVTVLNVATCAFWIWATWWHKISFRDSVGLRSQLNWFVASVGIGTIGWWVMYAIVFAFTDSFWFRAARYFSVCLYQAYASCCLLTVVPYKHIAALSENERRESLETIVGEKWSLDQFMCHLIGEFAQENLLFIVEAEQFRGEIGEPGNEWDAEGHTGRRLTLAQDIPKSEILLADTTDGEKARRIFEKYVKVGAEFEINVGWGTRKAWMAYFENGSEDWTKLAALFDETVGEIRRLLGDHLARFHATREDSTQANLFDVVG